MKDCRYDTGVNKGDYAPLKETLFRPDHPNASYVNDSCIAYELYLRHWTSINCDERHYIICHNGMSLTLLSSETKDRNTAVISRYSGENANCTAFYFERNRYFSPSTDVRRQLLRCRYCSVKPIILVHLLGFWRPEFLMQNFTAERGWG